MSDPRVTGRQNTSPQSRLEQSFQQAHHQLLTATAVMTSLTNQVGICATMHSLLRGWGRSSIWEEEDLAVREGDVHSVRRGLIRCISHTSPRALQSVLREQICIILLPILVMIFVKFILFLYTICEGLISTVVLIMLLQNIHVPLGNLANPKQKFTEN